VKEKNHKTRMKSVKEQKEAKKKRKKESIFIQRGKGKKD
jgi:hypothetical protein